MHRLQDSPIVAGPGDYRLGHAVTTVGYGLPPQYGPHDYDQFVEVVAGAPDTVVAGGTGMVRWLQLNPTDGSFTDSLSHPSAEVLSPSKEGFGAVVHGVDVLQHYVITHGAGPTKTKSLAAPGEEVLVGAPESESGNGAVILYDVRIPYADLTAAGDRSSWTWEANSTLVSPEPGPQRFGAAIAGKSMGQPGTQAPWFAVGAPGGGWVHIYQQSGFAPISAVLVQSFQVSDLAGTPPAASEFGAALLADDFDQDGTVDLAIGAPGGTQGHVFVERGNQSPASPADTLDLADWDFVTSSLGANDGFGSALASGRGFLNDGVGFGSSVAISNFSPRDPFLDDTTDEALVHELAVGAPGADAIAWTDLGGAFEPASDTPASAGAVVIFRSDPSTGPVFLANPASVTPRSAR